MTTRGREQSGWEARASRAVTVSVDASGLSRRRVQVRIGLPASPGPLVLQYPRWIPGEHRPTGEVASLAGLRLSAGNQVLAWKRDPKNLYAFRCEVPAAAVVVEAAFDYLLPGRPEGEGLPLWMASGVAILNWNAVVLVPRGEDPDRILYAASIKLPAGWRIRSALEASQGAEHRFPPVPLSTLIDSPVVLARHLHTLALGKVDDRAHFLDFAAGSPEVLAVPPEPWTQFRELILEAGLLFRSRPYRTYRWLVTLGTATRSYGLEHRESSDNRFAREALTREAWRRNLLGQLSHEYVHSWNGKYRCPVGLLPADYQQARCGELLWAYEGLTQYLGFVLAVRSGLWSEPYFREILSLTAARVDIQAGRQWRSLADTALAAQTLYSASNEWQSRRRGADFYEEGFLIWLEVDLLIREQTGDGRSLDDFCKRFFGGIHRFPTVLPYRLEDLIGALAEILPMDWGQFFDQRLHSTGEGVVSDRLTAAGWRLVFSSRANGALMDREERLELHDWSFSIGVQVRRDGGIRDVIPGLAADRAGLSPGMNLIAVNGKRWSADRIREALAGTQDCGTPIELLVEQDEELQVFRLDYFEGERFPHLERVESRADRLWEILAPRSSHSLPLRSPGR